MDRKNVTLLEDDEDPVRGPYDPDPDAGGDLWFLPPADDDLETGQPGDLPLPRAPRAASLVDGRLWQEAEAALAGDLAALTFDQGRLAERVAAMGQGALQRLALSEAASLSWWTGDRISADRLALWLGFRIGAAGSDGDGLIRTAWAARRLMAPSLPAATGLAAVLSAGLGSEDRTDASLLAEVAAVFDQAGALHSVTRGAALFSLWRSLDERPDHLREIEAAVLGARLAAGQGRGLAFLPLSRTGLSALTATGGPERRLAGWIAAAHGAVLAALLELDRVASWRARGEALTADLSGRTPGRLLACLTSHPMIAAPLAEAETGASRAAVQRNLDILAARGLVREVTGQGRFRIWAAAV